jgi:uncharacterized protein DUF5666
MYTPTRTRSGWALALGMGLMSLFVACGGEMSAGIQGSGSPVAAGVTAVGPISGFGSIFLDGVEYSTSGAQIRVDDQPGTEADLHVGQIITLKGMVNPDGLTGTASEVSYSGDLRGPVSQIDLDAATFVVLGQTVRVTDATLFDDDFQAPSLTGFPVGVVVEVSGFADAEGDLVASRVDPSTAASGLRVRGTVEGLDTTAQTFRINALTVDYSGVAPNGTLANGAFVSVQGTTLSAGGALIATRVQVIPGLNGAANEQGRIEGFITAFVSDSDFTVNGQRVLTDASTELNLRGATLGLDVPVKVRGTFDASGVLVASKVEVKPQMLSLVRGLVDSVSASGNTLTVLGVTIATNGSTWFDDKSSLPLKSFKLSDVRTGDYVEVRGTAEATGAGFTATLVERDKPEDLSYLQGIALNVASPGFTVLGVQVTTDSNTRFPGSGGGPDAATRFFSDAANQFVRVRGTVVGNALLAEQAQIRH